MSTPTTERFAALIERARLRNTEQVDMHVTASGKLAVLLARPNGSGGAARASDHAEGWRYVALIKRELDEVLPLARGLAADGQVQS